MKTILIWSWINLSTGVGVTATQEFDTPEACLNQKANIERKIQLERIEVKDSKITCKPADSLPERS